MIVYAPEHGHLRAYRFGGDGQFANAFLDVKDLAANVLKERQFLGEVRGIGAIPAEAGKEKLLPVEPVEAHEEHLPGVPHIGHFALEIVRPFHVRGTAQQKGVVVGKRLHDFRLDSLLPFDIEVRHDVELGNRHMLFVAGEIMMVVSNLAGPDLGHNALHGPAHVDEHLAPDVGAHEAAEGHPAGKLVLVHGVHYQDSPDLVP